MLSEQEIYERAVRGLDGQDWRRSVDEGGTCKYRGPDGLRCSVGHLVDDVTAEEWDELTSCGEGGSGVDSLSDSALAAGGLPSASRGLLESMQVVHDSEVSPENMRRRMHALAERFDVTWPADVTLPEVL